MRLGQIRNTSTGEIIDVKAVTNHPSCSYNKAVWVDNNNAAYMECDSIIDTPNYEVVYDTAIGRKIIGQQIADLRNKKGLSTRQLAELSGVNFANIGKIERGVYNASIDIIYQICRAMGVDIVLREKAAK